MWGTGRGVGVGEYSLRKTLCNALQYIVSYNWTQHVDGPNYFRLGPVHILSYFTGRKHYGKHLLLLAFWWQIFVVTRKMCQAIRPVIFADTIMTDVGLVGEAL